MSRALMMLLVLVVAPAAQAQSYLPLAIGNHWSYAAAGGLHEELTVTGTKTLRGRDVYVITYSNSSDNEGLENYWIPEPEGGVFLAGFLRESDSFGILYDPPLLYIDAPLAVGKTWSTASQNYTYPGETLIGPFDLYMIVAEDVTLSVPAGTYHAFGIGQTAPPMARRTTSGAPVALDGTVRSTFGSVASEWYAAGVGSVQYSRGGASPYQLVAFDGPTPVAATSWGRVKGLYR